MRLRRTLSLSQQQPAATDTHTDTQIHTDEKKASKNKTLSDIQHLHCEVPDETKQSSLISKCI